MKINNSSTLVINPTRVNENSQTESESSRLKKNVATTTAVSNTTSTLKAKINRYKAQRDEANKTFTPKEQRVKEFYGSKFTVTQEGGLLTTSKPYPKEVHSLLHTDANISGAKTAATMRALIAEGNMLAAKKSHMPDANIDLAKAIQNTLFEAAANNLSALTAPISLHIDKEQGISLNNAKRESVNEWVARNDNSETFIILNGNNDETYVNFIAETLKDSKNINFITSGFGGHGTTDRHNIAINKTEGDRFKEILVGKGISASRVTVDPFSTNSGQNATNVADILDRVADSGKPVSTVVVSGTPAAVPRQTLTYGQQLKLDNTKSFNIESFPFFNPSEYNTLADSLATIREFSTTLNYLFNTSYLPAKPELYSDDFFSAAKACFSTLESKLGSEHSEFAQQNKPLLEAMRNVDDAMIERFRSQSLTENDKAAVKTIDNFFRSLFNPLELTFKRDNS
ncbi:hypothetical protein PL78_18090 [Yersinia entomophaga]|uniref:DUF218 domain-containing protein n=1 Tax=Yersinia entomophaga TaxID=935293 RepID=A0ABM6BPY7_YERET|nr:MULTISPECIES: ElyC/SanA/YdcF family protein [Yersinia]ANI31718.1 hypothetical protein PL78_18090 [Yersinia entomophaga]OWF84993.1 hypothetical protein B4914_18155 [Yersinia entomophaga]